MSKQYYVYIITNQYNIEQAILKEKQIKDGSREKKIELVNQLNTKFIDLYNELL